MSVANSGIFTIVDAIQTELAELAASIPVAVNLDAINASIAALQSTVNTCSLYTQVVRQVQFTKTATNDEYYTSMGSVPPGVYAMSGTVYATSSVDGTLRLQGVGSYLTQGDITNGFDVVIPYSKSYFALIESSAPGMTVPMSGYITVTDPSEIFHRCFVVSNQIGSDNTFTVNVQLTRVNQVPA